jgi:hypothetical protein
MLSTWMPIGCSPSEGSQKVYLKSLTLKPSKNISTNFPTAFGTEKYILLKKKF